MVAAALLLSGLANSASEDFSNFVSAAAADVELEDTLELKRIFEQHVATATKLEYSSVMPSNVTNATGN
jgi:hypothetical protein